MGLVSYWADDLEAAKEWYAELLGIEPYFERPGYCEFRVGDYQHEMGLIDSRYAPASSTTGPGGAVLYWHVDDVAATLEKLLSMGAKEYEALTHRGEEGLVTASVADPFKRPGHHVQPALPGGSGLDQESVTAILGCHGGQRGARARRRWRCQTHCPGSAVLWSRMSKGDLMTAKPDLPTISFASRDGWEAWLDEHHADSDGLWLKIAKKGSGIETVTQPEALDVALCYGWIDSQADRFDGDYWLQRFTPRKPRSKWSRVNREKVEKLIEAGRMKPAGLREVERAKSDGRWEAAYEAQSRATVPDDLRRELEKNEVARGFFDALDSRNRYAILHRGQDAKEPQTRARRIEKYVAMLNKMKKIYP